MNVEKFIIQEIEKIKRDFGLSQIRDEVWVYVAENNFGILKLDAMIDRSMELYGEIIKRVNS